MSKLYFSESGNVVPTLCEELAEYRHARKVVNLLGTREPATLYILARSYPGNQFPLRISVNEQELPQITPSSPDIYLWYAVSIPPSLLLAGLNRFELWTDAPAMNAWSLGLENGHRDPESWISTDRGRTWRNEKMGFLNVSRGEYLVRVRLSEDSDPAPPRMVWENPDNKRLHRLRQMLPETVLKPGTTLERIRSLMTWVCTRWYYRCTTAPLYAPWDAETIMAWGRAGQGHDGREPIVMCVHYGVVLASCCAAIGIPARCAIFWGSLNGCNGHFTTEVWFKEWGKWVMVDPNMDAILFKEGLPLSVSEIQQAGQDLSGLIAWGPGFDYQIQNPVISDWIPKNYLTGLCFNHRSIWPRTDFLSSPELLPAGHGSTSYCETNLVWETRDLQQGFGMFPYFGEPAYFDAPPQDFPEAA